ncbi:MAG: hydroxymethylglutaryl-CoA synthase [Nitrososphaerota archaeon]|uniref:hydroxymethylglutaryl-CoA synthase n=1 Tax=Candidatus Bathycorpusculum sp. TaxID=2994959 RepID=UPI00282A5801|nr:hydroxymethylglutaryl-CoA synthase [Candidatus Termitimicrobium sp.]MCL2431067.1 hydroxymethylglutaryl-CoA synthase [Candidatus Termitimicrobium sp.]MDR0492837.1 hydroxymethylglutaryl-CoA synthase [Nitrososphaerota archaeon]
MTSEPIERRVTYLGDRLRACRCQCCGKEYFEVRDYCSNCGRKSYGRMNSIDLFYDKGILELCTYINEPTNKFTRLASYVYGIVSFHGGKIRVPARLTDQLISEGTPLDLASLEGREVTPRFRRRYSVGKSDIIPTISLAFTLTDEYYPHQEYKISQPSKDYELPGIVGYGVYSSRFRIKEEGIERAVPFFDEDSVTAAIEAGKLALIHSSLDSALIGKVYAGSESNPYAVKPIAAKVAQVLKLGKEDGDVQAVDAVDTEFACKAASSMFKDACALVSYPKSGIDYAMVIGTDNSQAAPRGWPGGELDAFVGYGGAAFIFGKKDVIAEVEAWYSCTSDTPDFWRRDGEPYPMHGGRFTGDPAYHKHVRNSASKLMEQCNLKASDLNYFVPHQPNPSFPVRIAKELGFKEEQFMPAIQMTKFGNTYSGASLVGLAAILDIAKPDDRILVTSYGSGAGSDSYLLRTTKQLPDKRNRQKINVRFLAENPFAEYIDYTTYRRLKSGM